MADAAVEFLLENLKQLLLYHAHLVHDAKNQVEFLEKNLRLFKAFLQDSTKKQRKDETMKELLRQIRDVVYEAEDIIDTFVTLAAEIKAKSYFERAFHAPTKLMRIAEKVKAIGTTVQDIQEKKIEFAQLQVEAAPEPVTEEKKAPMVREEVVGFEDEAETIIKYLTEETQELDIITIVGMPGLGKTTLAGKIFRDPTIQFEFPKPVWVYVSQEFRKKDVLLTILGNFVTKIKDDMYKKTDQDIVKILHPYLEKGKFLIVLDDVWSANAWEELQDAFPKSNSAGKILITSRNEEVSRRANRNREAHKLRLMRPDESWRLFQLEVFGREECPSYLEDLGRRIVEECKNLPLAIVVIGGTLVKKASYVDMGATINAWRKVSESVKTYLNDDEDHRMEKIIALSYDKLPYHLRPCFLYLGMFPEDFEIPVRKLTLMWIAEGFIQQKLGMCLEETAQDYLEDLINRNLLMVEKISPNGKIKTCRIHDMLREFCKNEAGNEKENFFQELRTAEGRIEPLLTEANKFRRLCIHSNVVKFVSSKPYGPCVRSFLCFSKEEITLLADKISTIPAAFKLLRVLEAKAMKFTKFPGDLNQLLHLRYLVMSIDFKILPKTISKLWNIQTIIINTTSSRTLEIKADIWKMPQLRHVKTNACTTIPKPGKSNEGEKQLQTLGTISHQSCTEDVFDRARNLKKLGIRGRIASLLDVKGMEKLENLEKLKLVNDVFPSPRSEGRLPSLPKHYRFPPKLRSLTLSATFFDWSHMSTLAMLNTLEVLKLKDNAFMGKVWEASMGGFRKLELLHIEHTDLVSWTASGHHFPRLICLVLRNCEELMEIPIGLAESLQKLELKRTNISAAASARRIETAKLSKQGQETNRRNQFKLVIAPGDELEMLTHIGSQ